jgi:hypothetical protein
MLVANLTKGKNLGFGWTVFEPQTRKLEESPGEQSVCIRRDNDDKPEGLRLTDGLFPSVSDENIARIKQYLSLE